MSVHLPRSCIMIATAATALFLTACGVTVTAVHLPDSIQVNVGATAETAASYETAQEADSAAQQAAAGKIDWTWTVGDESIATVDENGIITGIKGGDTIVVVSSADGKLTARCPVTVSQPLMAIQMNDIDLQTNGQNSATVNYTLVPADTTEDNVTLSIDDESVARLDGNKIVAVTNGETKITAICGIVKTSAKVTVTTKVEQITLDKTEGILTVGNSVTITATVTPDNATDTAVNWTSSDESVATVDQTGKVTAVAAGNATITATSESDGDVSADYELTVENKKVINYRTGSTSSSNSGGTSTISNGAASSPSYTTPTTPSVSEPTYVPEPAPDPTPAEPTQPSGGDSGNSGGEMGVGNYGEIPHDPNGTQGSGIDWTQDNSNGVNNNDEYIYE